MINDERIIRNLDNGFTQLGDDLFMGRTQLKLTLPDADRMSLGTFSDRGFKDRKPLEPQKTSSNTEAGLAVGISETEPSPNVVLNSTFDANSFPEAFSAARRSGAQTFSWRGNEYTTELAQNVPSVTGSPQATPARLESTPTATQSQPAQTTASPVEQQRESQPAQTITSPVEQQGEGKEGVERPRAVSTTERGLQNINRGLSIMSELEPLFEGLSDEEGAEILSLALDAYNSMESMNISEQQRIARLREMHESGELAKIRKDQITKTAAQTSVGVGLYLLYRQGKKYLKNKKAGKAPTATPGAAAANPAAAARPAAAAAPQTAASKSAVSRPSAGKAPASGTTAGSNIPSANQQAAGIRSPVSRPTGPAKQPLPQTTIKRSVSPTKTFYSKSINTSKMLGKAGIRWAGRNAMGLALGLTEVPTRIGNNAIERQIVDMSDQELLKNLSDFQDRTRTSAAVLNNDAITRAKEDVMLDMYMREIQRRDLGAKVRPRDGA